MWPERQMTSRARFMSVRMMTPLASVCKWLVWFYVVHLVNGEESLLNESYIEVEEFVPEDSLFDAENLQKSWTDTAIRNVAFFLRHHKFNEYDRRFPSLANSDNPPKTFYKYFPIPALRSLEWEVHEKCSEGLVSCLEYLDSKIKNTPFQRDVDTNHVMRIRGWEMPRNWKSIKNVDRECKQALDEFNNDPTPFDGFLERFRWSTTASYYMCWFTLQRYPVLSAFGEPCDNLASCLDMSMPEGNHDPRANDSLPFACAMYSFCPDPCCQKSHVSKLSECETANSCSDYRRTIGKNNTDLTNYSCGFDHKKNLDLSSIILNQWNVSCSCSIKGFIWESRYGMCVDINECADETDGCDKDTEACWNLAGGYSCHCKWGFIWDNNAAKCKQYDILSNVLNQPPHGKLRFSNKIWGNLKKFKYNMLFKEGENESKTYYVEESNASTCTTNAFYITIFLLMMYSVVLS